ncbi:MAG: hypothetical protein H7322_01300 [Ramlibacter sp.]|nr:hypothetical protein [Ramlibacter sp.]
MYCRDLPLADFADALVELEPVEIGASARAGAADPDERAKNASDKGRYHAPAWPGQGNG